MGRPLLADGNGRPEVGLSPQATAAPADALRQERFTLAIPALLLGTVAAQHGSVGGELYVGEIVGIALLASLLRSRRLHKHERVLLYLAVLWSAAQLLSDLINETALSDSIKGVAAPLVFIATVLGFAHYFSQNPRRMPSFLLGVGLGTLVGLLLFPTIYSSINAWKFGAGGAVLTVVLVYFSFFARRASLPAIWVTLVAFALLSLHYDSRSIAVLPLLAGVAYTLARTTRGKELIGRSSGGWRATRLVILVVLAMLPLNVGVSAVLTSQTFLSQLSPAAAQKYEAQASGAFGVLLGGRPDTLASIQAFLDKPILGHGSWAKDTQGYRQALGATLYDLGYSQSYLTMESTPWIPTHSYLMGALVWSGIAGGLFWLVVLYYVVRRFGGAMSWLPIYFYAGTVAFLWDLWFSPFGASARWSTAVFLSALLAWTLNRPEAK